MGDHDSYSDTFPEFPTLNLELLNPEPATEEIPKVL
jgi:hypothetical protein